MLNVNICYFFVIYLKSLITEPANIIFAPHNIFGKPPLFSAAKSFFNDLYDFKL
jgi:hypothetical protein